MIYKGMGDLSDISLTSEAGRSHFPIYGISPILLDSCRGCIISLIFPHSVDGSDQDQCFEPAEPGNLWMIQAAIPNQSHPLPFSCCRAALCRGCAVWGCSSVGQSFSGKQM